jgi:hypothetical protein
MLNKQQILKIKTNTERTIQGLLTNPKEFVYEQSDRPVRSGVMYSIYYTLGKKEVYLTGIIDTTNSKEIKKVNKTLFSKYTSLKVSTRQKYPNPSPTIPLESDYRIGRITRYFTQLANDPNSQIFEISKDDYNAKNNLYRYTSFKWTISGTKEEVIRQNSVTIRQEQRNYVGIEKVLFPLQLWKPTKK